MEATVRARFWLEGALASVGAVLAVLTVLWRDWIEAVTRLDPDHHSGSLEWLIAAGLLVLALGAGAAARSEWSRVAPAS